MKQLIILFSICFSSVCISQKYINMSKELSNIKGNLIIDGNSLKLKHDTREEIIIIGEDLRLNDKSGIVLNNVIVELSGRILVEDDAKVYPKIIDSYIFCKSSDNLSSSKIIVKSKFNRYVELSRTKFIKRIKGNPKLYIYDSKGKCKFKGLKSETVGEFLNISRYDIKIDGKNKSFKNKVLLI